MIRLLAAAMCVGLSFSTVRAETPTAFMQTVIKDLVAASRAPRSEAMSDFASCIRNYADIPSIGLSALGSYSRSLPKAERPFYYNGMITFIARYAATEAPKYQVARAVVVGQPSPHQYGVYVDSRIELRSRDTYDIRWILVKRGAVWKVRDVEYLGFRMTSQLDTLFQNFIAENGGNPKKLAAVLNQ